MNLSGRIALCAFEATGLAAIIWIWIFAWVALP